MSPVNHQQYSTTTSDSNTSISANAGRRKRRVSAYSSASNVSEANSTTLSSSPPLQHPLTWASNITTGGVDPTQRQAKQMPYPPPSSPTGPPSSHSTIGSPPQWDSTAAQQAQQAGLPPAIYAVLESIGVHLNSLPAEVLPLIASAANYHAMNKQRQRQHKQNQQNQQPSALNNNELAAFMQHVSQQQQRSHVSSSSSPHSTTSSPFIPSYDPIHHQPPSSSS